MQNFLITLLICSITMSVLALLYMAATPFLEKRYSAKGRYVVWLIIMVGLIIPFRPQWGNALFSVEVPTSTPPSVVQINGEAPSQIIPPTNLPPIDNVKISETALNISWWQIGFAVWAAELIIFIAYHGIKHYRFGKMVRRWSEEITDGYILSLLESLKSEMGIKQRIPIYLCAFAGSPMIIGLFKPRILLPTVEMAQEDLCFILKHELVHYKRKDLLCKYLIMAATAIHWFNPIVYKMARAVNVLCETSCDAEVLRNADENTRQSYGETIIGVVQYHSKLKTALSTNFYGGKNSMKTRISSIMDTSKKRVGAVIVSLVLVATLSTGFAFAVNAYTAISDNSTLTVTVNPDSNPIEANTLTADEAAQYAARHILEIFGVDIDGSVVQMTLNDQWVALVADTNEAMANLDWNFRVTLNAVTGEDISVQKNGRGLMVTPGSVPPRPFFSPAGADYTVEISGDFNGQRVPITQDSNIINANDFTSFFNEFYQNRQNGNRQAINQESWFEIND